MKWHHTFLAAAMIALPGLLPGALRAQTALPQVYSDAGNIFIARGGAKTRITASEMDVDPVLSPNGDTIVYTRQGRGRTLHGYDPTQLCTTEPRPDELRQINVDGSGDKLVLTGRKGDPEHQLCDFRNKQFSSDGRRLYFLTPGWATSGALHVLDTKNGDERFLLPANDLLVLNFCPNKYKDYLVVRSRRAFLFGGGYDWYWLYDPSGKKELGPLGDFANPDDMSRQAHGVWCASKP